MQGQRTSNILFLDISWASEALNMLTASSPPLKQGTIVQQFPQPRNQPWFLFILAWQVCSLAGIKSQLCPQDDTRPAPYSWLFIYSQAHLLGGSVSVWCSAPTDMDVCVWLSCDPQLRKALSTLVFFYVHSPLAGISPFTNDADGEKLQQFMTWLWLELVLYVH